MDGSGLVLLIHEAYQGFLPFTWLEPWSLRYVGSVRVYELWRYVLGVEPETVYIQTAEWLATPHDEGKRLRVVDALPTLDAKEQHVIEVDGGWIPRQSARREELQKPSEAHIIRTEAFWQWIVHLGDLLDFLFARVLPALSVRRVRPERAWVAGDDLWVRGTVTIRHAFLNTETGPIFLDDGVEVMEGAMIRGPVWIGPNTQIKMGAKIYGPVLVGPTCKVGGELHHVWIDGFTNKAHDGFLGHALIGKWCNLGADTNNSNLKNNYAPVKIWSYVHERFVETGEQFLGLFLADHSRSGINTMFNTGTVAGPFANVFGGGFPRTFIPPFAWGGSAGFQTFRVDKAIEMAERMMRRRQRTLTDQEKARIEEVFRRTARYRWWETART